MFALNNLYKKYLRNKKVLYVAFMDLEKAYDGNDRDALRKVLCTYGVGGYILEAEGSFHQKNKVHAPTGSEEGE